MRRGSFTYVDLQDIAIKLLREPGGSADMNVNGSSTAVEFRYTCPPGFDFLVHRLNSVLIDNVAMNADEFGGIMGGLTNGIEMSVRDGADVKIKDFATEALIKRNGDFALLAGVDVTQLGGNKGIGVRWTWSKASGGDPIRIPENYSFVMRIQDDLTGLITYRSTLQGVLVPKQKASEA